MSTLDPQDMVAAVESSRFRTIPIHQSRRPGAMKKWVESRAVSENNGVMERPPLDIILHEDDLMVEAWGWDRLLPWITGYVHFKQYLKYLKHYLHQNHHYTSACAAATRCLEEEKNLSDAINKVKSIHGDAGLTLKIIEQGTHIVHSALECRLAAACFMCIAEEAKLMSEWLTSCTPKDHGSMVKSWQWISDFGYQVQKLTLDILTTYNGKGNNTDHVIAALLGMTKEAVIARELLKMNHTEQEKLDVCEELRGDLKDLLVLLLEKCPQDSAIDLRQNDHHVDSTTKFTHLQISDERKDDLSSHPSTPMNNSTPATPEPWLGNYDALAQYSNNNPIKKRSRESEEYNFLVSDPRKHGRVAEESGSQSSYDVVAASITPTTIKLATPATTPSWVSSMDSYDDESVQVTQGTDVPSSSMASANVDEDVCQ